MLAARRDLEQARDEVLALRRDVDLLGLIDGEGRGSVETIRDDFEEAARQLRSPVVWPVRVLPILGRQQQAAASMADGVAEALEIGLATLERADAELGDGVGTGPERAGQLAKLAAIAHDARELIAAIDLGTDDALIGSLADARRDLRDEIDQLEDGLQKAETTSLAFADLMTGSHRYLVLAANNAQMQNGSGMMLSSAVLTFDDGHMDLSDIEPFEAFPLPAPPVELDPDLAATWPALDPNTDWRHLGTSARFPITAQTAARMWAAVGQPPVEGVLAVDPATLRALVVATGPVSLEGREINANTVLPFLLHAQYVEAFGDTTGSKGEQLARRDRLGVLAEVVIDAVDDTSLELGKLDELALAAAGRHLLAWSSDPDMQAGFEAAGIDGELPDDALVVGVLNRSGVKLDWFVDVSADLTHEVNDDGTTDVRVRVRLDNRAEIEGEPAYVVGPYPDSGLVKGEYLGIVAFTFPGDAPGVEIGEGQELVAAGRDGSHQVVGIKVQIKAGKSQEVELRFTLPKGQRSLLIVPSARIGPIKYQLDTRDADDDPITDRRRRRWDW